MSAMKRLLDSRTNEVENIVQGVRSVHIAARAASTLVVKAFHHSQVKSLIGRLTKAGYKAKAFPFLNGRYNVTINLDH